MKQPSGMGPFNYLGSCCALEERHWYEMRNHGLLRQHGRSVATALRKIAIGNSDAHAGRRCRWSDVGFQGE